MAELIRCTDRYAHVELLIPRELWGELMDRHLTLSHALRAVRVSALNGIRARLVELGIQELEHRYGNDPLATSSATAQNSDSRE